jgi:hypothetical protein
MMNGKLLNDAMFEHLGVRGSALQALDFDDMYEELLDASLCASECAGAPWRTATRSSSSMRSSSSHMSSNSRACIALPRTPRCSNIASLSKLPFIITSNSLTSRVEAIDCHVSVNVLCASDQSFHTKCRCQEREEAHCCIPLNHVGVAGKHAPSIAEEAGSDGSDAVSVDWDE